MPSFPKNAPIRLEGVALTALRLMCFERDQYRCQHVMGRIKNFGLNLPLYCHKQLVWESGLPNSGHMAHIKGRGRGGPDTLENVRLLCPQHHDDEHNAGGKPVPAKEKPCAR